MVNAAVFGLSTLSAIISLLSQYAKYYMDKEKAMKNDQEPPSITPVIVTPIITFVLDMILYTVFAKFICKYEKRRN